MIYHAPLFLLAELECRQAPGDPGSYMWKMAEPLAAGSLSECVQEGHLATRRVSVKRLHM